MPDSCCESEGYEEKNDGQNAQKEEKDSVYITGLLQLKE